MNQACPQCAFPFAEGQQDAFSFCPKCSFPLMRVAGKYRLTRLLGEGSFGRVYLARHMNLRHKPERVIKVMRSDVLRQHGMEDRFWREIQLTAVLSEQNAHVVRVYDDFGEEDGLGFYYVMEYLRGRSLKEVCRACGPLPLPLVWHIFRQLCEAVTLAHNEGIIHRDLKPQNIYLIPRGRDPYFVKIFDFGIAKSLVEAKQADWTRGALGTPAYMAPEQCNNRQIDQRTDLYAMAVILYEMLSGRTPFLFEGLAQGTSPDPMTILIAHMTQPPTPLAKQAPWLMIDSALDQAILKALAKDPAERYESAETLWRTILRHLSPDIFQQPLPTPRELLGPDVPVLSSDGWSAVEQLEESDAFTPVPSSSALWGIPPSSKDKNNEHADASDEYSFPSSALVEKAGAASSLWPERTLDLGGILSLRKEQQTLALGEGDLLEDMELFSAQEQDSDLSIEGHTPDPRRLVETLNLRVPTESVRSTEPSHTTSLNLQPVTETHHTALDVSPFTQPLPRPAFAPIWSDTSPPHSDASEATPPVLQEPTRAYGVFQDDDSFASSPFQSEKTTEHLAFSAEKTSTTHPTQEQQSFTTHPTQEQQSFTTNPTQEQQSFASKPFRNEHTVDFLDFQKAKNTELSAPKAFSPARSPVESIKIPLFLEESSSVLSSLSQERTLEIQSKKRPIFFETDTTDTELSETKQRQFTHEKPFAVPPMPPTLPITSPNKSATEALGSLASPASSAAHTTSLTAQRTAPLELPDFSQDGDDPVFLAKGKQISENGENDDAPVLLAEDEVPESENDADVPVLLAEEDDASALLVEVGETSDISEENDAPVLLAEAEPLVLGEQHRSRPASQNSTEEIPFLLAENPPLLLESSPTNQSTISPHEAVTVSIPNPLAPKKRLSVTEPLSSPSSSLPLSSPTARPTVPFVPPTPSFSVPVSSVPPTPPPSVEAIPSPSMSGIFTDPPAPPDSGFLRELDRLLDGLGTGARKESAAQEPSPEPSVELVLGQDDLFEGYKANEENKEASPEPSVELVLGQDDLVEQKQTTETKAAHIPEPSVELVLGQSDLVEHVEQTDEHKPVSSVSPELSIRQEATQEMAVLLQDPEPTQEWQDTLDSRELDAASQEHIAQILEETREPSTSSAFPISPTSSEPSESLEPLESLEPSESLESSNVSTSAALSAPVDTSKKALSAFALPTQEMKIPLSAPKNTPLSLLMSDGEEDELPPPPISEVDISQFASTEEADAEAIRKALMATLPPNTPLTTSAFQALFEEAQAAKKQAQADASPPSVSQDIAQEITGGEEEPHLPFSEENKEEHRLDFSEDDEEEEDSFSAPTSSSSRRLNASASPTKAGAFASLLDEAHKTEALIEATFSPPIKDLGSSEPISEEEEDDPDEQSAAPLRVRTPVPSEPSPAEPKPPSVRSAFSIQAVQLTPQEAEELQIPATPTEEEQIAARLLQDGSQDGLLTEESLPSAIPSTKADTSGVDRKAPLRLSPTSLLVDENALFEDQDAVTRRRNLLIGGALALSIVMIFVALGALLGWFSPKTSSSLSNPLTQTHTTPSLPNGALASAQKNDLPLDIREASPNPQRPSDPPPVSAKASDATVPPTRRLSIEPLPSALPSSAVDASPEKEPTPSLSIPPIPPLPTDSNAPPVVIEPSTPRKNAPKTPTRSSAPPALSTQNPLRTKPRKRPKVAAITTSSDRCPDGMAWIPAGTFPMGSAVSDPMHFFGEKALERIATSGFCIDRYEAPGKGQMPLRNVSWSEAKKRCATQGKRLCSEVEWERACKGSSERRFPYGNSFQPNRCNTRDAKGQNRNVRRTGSLPRCKSPLGIFDLSGNVAEWTASPFLRKGWRIIRGGSFNRPDWDVRCASRGGLPPNARKTSVGFRCCSSPK